jgi:cob(I)alamin adenosyltransferase
MTEKHSKIYTRKGDDGSTSLMDGKRVQKDHVRMEAIGTVDELSSLIGVLAAMDIPQEHSVLLENIQHNLFNIGAGLATPNGSVLHEERVTDLERAIDQIDAKLPPLKRFILPGGTPAAASCHTARAVCRRAERRVLSVQQTENDQSDATALHYLNRLSDLLFVLARALSRLNGGEEIFWDNR